MSDLEHAELATDNIADHRFSAVFVFLLAVLIYMFFTLDAAEAQDLTVQLKVNGLTTTQMATQATVGEFIDTVYPDPQQIINVSPGRSIPIVPNMMIAIQAKPTILNPLVATNLSVARQPAPEPVVVAAVPEPIVETTPKSPTYSGTATWYKHGSGLTAASTQFPKGTALRVTADASNKQVDVVINDYGPTAETGISLDLNKPAFLKLAPLGAGKINIHYYVI